MKYAQSDKRLCAFYGGLVFFIGTSLCSSEKFPFVRENGYCSLQKTAHGISVWYAVEQGYIHTLRVFINTQKLLNTKNRRGETLLYRAIKEKNIKNIKFLLQAGADVYSRTKTGETLFEAASTICDQKIKETVIQLLLQSGFDVNKHYEEGRTLLHTAVLNNHTDFMRLLLDHKADVNVYERYFTPLQSVVALYARAPQEQRLNTIKFLLNNSSCDINALTKSGYAPLHIAVSFCNPKLCSLLLSHKADCAVVDKENNTPLYLATLLNDPKKKQDHLDIIALLLKNNCPVNMQNNQKLTPLHGAVRSNFVEAVALLMQHDVDYTVKDLYGVTPLQRALKMHSLLGTANALKRNRGIIKLFIENSCSVNERFDAGLTPLHYAVLSGDALLVALLIHHGANVNVQTDNQIWNDIPYYKATPLVLACYKKYPTLVKLLLRAGAKQDILCEFFDDFSSCSSADVAFMSGCNESKQLLDDDQELKRKFKHGIVRGLFCKETNIPCFLEKRIYAFRTYKTVPHIMPKKSDTQVVWFMKHAGDINALPSAFLLSKIKKKYIVLDESENIFFMSPREEAMEVGERLISPFPSSINFNPKKRSKLVMEKNSKKIVKG